jgi:hypothetical protein
MQQAWIRQTFALAPLDVEFLLWLGKPAEVKSTGKMKPKRDGI